MNKKILIVSLFATLMLLVPMTSALNINTDINKKSGDIHKIESLDTHNEKISYISGSANVYGSPPLGINAYGGYIDIFALTVDGYFYIEHTSNVYAELFIGLCLFIGMFWAIFWGVAIGNIDWK